MNTKNKDNINLVQKFSDIVNSDNLSELEYETEEIKIKIVKNANKNLSNIKTVVSQEPQDIDSKGVNQLSETEEKFTNKHPGAVNSPMVGTAYSSPEPGKEAFIKINSSVEQGDTLLIIEAMKVMNTITAHKSGKITFIGFEDNQPIEFNQLLLIIE